MKKAILAVSFGTSHRDTCARNIGAIEADLTAAFPGWELRRAFTSGMIIRKLRSRDSLEVDTVSRALERLAEEGFDRVVIQPTHILNGEEFDDIVADTAPFRARLRLEMGAPLLTSTADYRALAGAVSRAFPPAERAALCLMGHGSTHFADAAYAALDYHFKDMGRVDIFVGTVEGYPDLETLLRAVGRSGAERVVLAPLMVVAGDHAVNDMAGGGEDSWQRAFEAAGYGVECVLRGLGEYPEVRRLYVEHACAAVQRAEQSP